ncbi:MAG TPA: heavy-metal-associated domain-containing protein [Mogibacterium sp.]|nr:heavy-metal-associated domain-containing protein [Mogibacterium sp.]
MKKTYKIEVDCPVCADKMERAAKKTKGVKNVSINFMMLKMNVEFDEGANPETVMQEVRTNCKKIESDCEVFY